MQSYYDAIVIGSGFGGAIAAMRIANAGKSTLLLERGKHYQAGEFPRLSHAVNDLFWRYPQDVDARGLFEYRVYSGAAVLTASGFGGGSLIYANVHDQPDASVFTDPRWPAKYNLDYLKPFYTKVATMLQLRQMPEQVTFAKRQQFELAADALQFAVAAPDQAIDWDVCSYCGECEIGCQDGAKQSLDKNYLAAAQQSGAEFKAQAHVHLIEPTFHGYYVHFTDLNDARKKKQVKARVVVVAAGTLGTNELLLRSRDQYQTLPKLSKRLGTGFSVNGDFLGSIQNAAEQLESWKGPSITSVMRASAEATRLSIVTPTLNQAMTEVMSAIGQPDGKLLRFFGPLFWSHLDKLVPAAFAKDWINKPGHWNPQGRAGADRYTNLFAMGHDNANGKIRLKRTGIDIEWDYYLENKSYVDQVCAVLGKIAAQYQGEFSPFLAWNMAQRPTSIHPLGGCAMGATDADSVVSENGEVHGYPGLFVMDGSVLPTGLGCYPAMTIAALAEHHVQSVISQLGS